MKRASSCSKHEGGIIKSFAAGAITLNALRSTLCYAHILSSGHLETWPTKNKDSMEEQEKYKHVLHCL